MEITPDGQILVRAPVRMSRTDIDRFAAAHAAWAEKHLEQARRRAAYMPPDLSREEILVLAAKAQAILPPKVAYWSRVTGLIPTGITITAARSRYGSCSAKNRLSFSCFLVNYPEAAIDLVVVHELCHIRVKNHGPEFYALLSSFLPDHKERKKLLRNPDINITERDKNSGIPVTEGDDML